MFSQKRPSSATTGGTKPVTLFGICKDTISEMSQLSSRPSLLARTKSFQGLARSFTESEDGAAPSSSFYDFQNTGSDSAEYSYVINESGDVVTTDWVNDQLRLLAMELLSPRPQLSKLQLLTSVLLEALSQHTAGLADESDLVMSLSTALINKQTVLARMFPDESRENGAESAFTNYTDSTETSTLSSPAIAAEHNYTLPKEEEEEPIENREANTENGDQRVFQVLEYEADSFDVDKARQLEAQVKSDPAVATVSGSLDNPEGKTWYACRKCSVVFSWRRHLEMHFVQQHRTHEKPFLCHTCGNTFTRADHLNRHAQNHEESDHVCQLCTETFSRASHMDRHWMKDHEPELPGLCASALALESEQRGALPEHKLQHVTPKSVKSKRAVPKSLSKSVTAGTLSNKPASSLSPSSNCKPKISAVAMSKISSTTIKKEEGSQFLSKSSPHLTLPHPAVSAAQGRRGPGSPSDHTLQSLKDKKYRAHHCNECGRMFERLTHLRRHLRIHSGERPFACALCPKKYARGDYLRSHIQTMHDENRIKCHLCHRVFATISSLRNHHCESAPGGHLRAWYLQSTFLDVDINGAELQDVTGKLPLTAEEAEPLQNAEN